MAESLSGPGARGIKKVVEYVLKQLVETGVYPTIDEIVSCTGVHRNTVYNAKNAISTGEISKARLKGLMAGVQMRPAKVVEEDFKYDDDGNVIGKVRVELIPESFGGANTEAIDTTTEEVDNE